MTGHPTSAWVIQQLREAFPYDSAPAYLIFDRGPQFNDEVIETVKSFGIQPKRTSFRSPWQNGVAERWVGSCRRDLLDHVIVLNERHLKRLMAEYVRYYHHDRTHLGLAKDTPVSRPMALALPPEARFDPLRDSADCTIATLHNSETDRVPWEAHRNTAKKHTSHESTNGDCRLPGKCFSSKRRARTVRNKCASGFREVLRIDNAILCLAA